MDDLYRENILDHYRNPRNFGRIKNPDATWEENNPVCGDKIGMDLKWNGEILQDIRFFGEGCAIAMSSASLLTEKVKGMKKTDLKKITPKNIKEMLNIEPTPTRLKCALLSLETLHKALDLVKKV